MPLHIRNPKLFTLGEQSVQRGDAVAPDDIEELQTNGRETAVDLNDETRLGRRSKGLGHGDVPRLAVTPRVGSRSRA